MRSQPFRCSCRAAMRAAAVYTPDDAVDEPLLAVLGGVGAVDVQRLEDGVRHAAPLDVLLHLHVAWVCQQAGEVDGQSGSMWWWAAGCLFASTWHAGQGRAGQGRAAQPAASTAAAPHPPSSCARRPPRAWARRSWPCRRRRCSRTRSGGRCAAGGSGGERRRARQMGQTHGCTAGCSTPQQAPQPERASLGASRRPAPRRRR